MPETKDRSHYEWLDMVSEDGVTRELLKEIRKCHEDFFDHGIYLRDDSLLRLTLLGMRLCVRRQSAFSSLDIFAKIFRSDDHFLLEEFHPRHARTVIDAGANEGFYTLRMKRENPECRVIAIEPNPYSLDLLHRNLSANSLGGVRTIAAALGASSGTAKLECVDQFTAICGAKVDLFPRRWLDREFVVMRDVPVVTLDEALDSEPLEHVDVLKMDVEGMELEAFQGAERVLERVDKIVVEWHGLAAGEAVRAFLEERGFERLFHEDWDLFGDSYFRRSSGRRRRTREECAG